MKLRKVVRTIGNTNLKSLIFGKAGGHKGSDTEDSMLKNASSELVPISEIKDGIVITRDGRYVKIIEILPVNFYLRSEIEQQNIIWYFSSYLKVAPNNIQILIKTQKADVDDYCENMERYYEAEENESCRSMVLENAEMVNYLARNEAITRRFFMVIEYEDKSNAKATFEDIVKILNEQADTAEKYLDYCGLECVRRENEDEFLLKLFYTLLNKRISNVMPLKESVTFSGDTDMLAPTYVDTGNKEYIEIDGVYYAYLYITGYGYKSQVQNAWLAVFVESGDGVSVNFILKRQHRENILPKMSRTVMLNRARIKDVDEIRNDYEEMDSAISAGVYMKDEMNRNGEDFYYMHTLIEITAEDEETLGQRVNSFEIMCGSMGFTVRRTYCKQEQAFISSLPILKLDENLEKKSKRNILTSGVAAAFPFSSFELCDRNGILFGINRHNRSAVIMDLFDADKYNNANLSIMGMSGAGKTFLLQLIALRLRMQDVQVFLLAPLKGHEFRDACEAIGGKFIKLSPGSTDCINIMEIRKGTLDTDADLKNVSRDDSVLSDKIQKLHIFFSLLHPAITHEEVHLFDIALVETYRRFGIMHDNRSLYNTDGSFKIMPTLSDLYNTLNGSSETKKLALVVQRFVSGSAAGLGGATNVDLDNKYTVLDISELGKDLNVGMFIALDYIWDKVKRSRIEKKAVILDEIWELIGAGSNEQAAEFTLEIFKIIRGYAGAAISATQDMVDYFSLADGKYGKSILNNCRTKIVLQMEEDEALTVQKYLNLSDEETMQIIRSEQGQGLLCAGRNRISVEFRASQTEYDLITTKRTDLEKRVAKSREQEECYE